VANGHRLVVQGVEVDSDAERGTDLVLAPVAPADVAAGLVGFDLPSSVTGTPTE